MSDSIYMEIGVFDRRTNENICDFVSHRFGTPENLKEFIEATFKSFIDEYGIDVMVNEIDSFTERTPLLNHTIDHLVQIKMFIHNSICKYYNISFNKEFYNEY